METTTPTYSVILARKLAGIKGVGSRAFRAPIEGGDLPASTTIFHGDARVILRDGVAIGEVYKVGNASGFQAFSFRTNPSTGETAQRAYGATEEEALASFKHRFEGYLARPVR